MTTIDIQFRHRDTVSYPAAYNRADFIEHLAVGTTDGSTVHDVLVTVSLESSDGVLLMDPWTRRLDILGPIAVQWDATDFRDNRIDASAVSAFTDQQWSRFTIRVNVGDTEIARRTSDASILAHNFWAVTAPKSIAALELAAFAQPNHPSLVSVLQTARENLRRGGRAGELSGYQSTANGEGAAHIDAMVGAIYDAVRTLDIGYIDPPPSWDAQASGHQGQKVRTAAQVLEDRFGTCLDTAALCAALVENVGLYPVIVIVPGHAFAGYWRDEHAGHRAPVLPVRDVMNDVQSGALQLFETTTLTGGSASKPFAEASRLGLHNLDQYGALDPELAGESWVIDVVRARQQARILPLPARVELSDGSVEVVEYRPQEFSVNMLENAVAEHASTRAGLASQNAPRRVKTWMDSLLDLTLRNPLLNYRFPRASSTSLYVPAQTLGTVEDMLQSGVKIKLSPGFEDSSGRIGGLTARRTPAQGLEDDLIRALSVDRALHVFESGDTFLTRMRRIAANARSLVAEHGTNSLHLALGMVVWTPEGKQEVSSPLILLPVNLVPSNRSRTFHLEVDATSSVTPNFSLAEKLKRDAGLNLPGLIEPELDDAGIDVPALIAYVRTEFQRAGLHEFRVDESCTLGFFDFSTYRMWRDLQDHWPTLTERPLVKHLVHSPYDAFDDPATASLNDETVDLDDFAAGLPIAADGSQARAVMRALDGQTFVLQGPPGTGKSQTITNLLAQALHSGMRVLFIAEKATALGVVRDRLAQVGLGAFGLNLHSRGMSPAEVRHQLARSLDATAVADAEGFTTARAEIDRAIPPLKKYPERLHQIGEFGESAYSARNRLLAMGEGTRLRFTLAQLMSLSRDDVAEIRATMRDLQDIGPAAGSLETNAWSIATITADDLTAERRTEISEAVNAVASALANASDRVAAREYLLALTDMAEVLTATNVDAATLGSVQLADAAAGEDQTRQRHDVRQSLSAWEPGRVDTRLSEASLFAPTAEIRASLDSARASFFIGRKKRVNAVAQRLAPYVASAPGPEDGALEAVIEVVGQAQASAARLAQYVATTAGVNVGPEWNPLRELDRGAVLQQLDAVDSTVAVLADDGSSERSRIRTLASRGSAEDRVAVANLARATTLLFTVLGATPSSTQAWLRDRAPISALADASSLWASDVKERGLIQLSRWTALQSKLATISSRGLGDHAHAVASGEVAYHDAESAFERGLLGAILEQQIESQSLHAFDGRQHDSQVRTYARGSAELRRLSPSILAHEMLQARGFDGGATVGAIGELRRELGKRRGTKPVRQLIKDHWHVISKLTPCVLAVPDAAVRYLDASNEPFDLVVFDEASQIRVAHAIGVLGRARAAVVVGDSKQMPPTSIAEVAVEVEDDGAEDEVIDEESILTECVQARVPALMLNWHYRSEDETLIAFSNAKYYEGHLNSLPSPSAELATKGVSLRRVDGQFVQRGMGSPTAPVGTNEVEAHAIVEEIRRRANDPSSANQSMGVVTFNKPQQQLIRALLEDIDDDATQELLKPVEDESAHERIEVWNLETVQGQERDVILFSVAFSKNSTGRIPLNFGPLNKVGGERRLNVAVTRARRQVVVFSSFEPEELQAENSSSVGLKHLKEYLLTAKHGPQVSGAIASSVVKAPDRHRDAILEALKARGLDAAPDVGLSEFKVDIAIRAPGHEHWTVGVLVDGAAWHARPTVGDRDALPVTLLEARMGWKAVTRVWTPDWLRDAPGEVDRIAELVDDVAQRPEVPAPPPPPTMSGLGQETATQGSRPASLANVPARRSAPPQSAHDPFAKVPKWRAWAAPQVGTADELDYLADADTRQKAQHIAKRVVDHEGPAHPDRVAKLVANSFGLKRVASRRLAAIRSVVRPTFQIGPDGFYFPRDTDPLTHSEWRRSDPQDGRVPDEVSLVELGNAMVSVARIGLGAGREDLLRGTASCFGVARLTEGTRERLAAALALALERGILTTRGEHLVAAEE
ncbi:DUF4011 domain-containing protein [Demequina muriae]|uniref:DUF4011 domain-containing protein n=1 Tax=Demequina muriae TaxID=3051664 RepID=A0ABT8GEM4_9MICO|nr:DUF4011 domain-containing protein [Demequina sp. EGI L300058]MDN4479706.1 DUF4011 domain-containing protein [Demequina sp. EGI L300058]